MEYCLFQLNHRTYAIPLAHVREVLIRPLVTKIPLAPGLLAGMTGFRGEVLPVFSIDMLFHPESTPASNGARSRVLVLSHGEAFYGIFVDQVGRFDFSGEDLPPTDAGFENLSQEISVQGNNYHFLSPASLYASLAESFKTPQQIF